MKKQVIEKKNPAYVWLSIPIQIKHRSFGGVKKINFNTCFEDGSLIKVDRPDCLVLLCRNSHLIPESFIWKSFFKSLNKFIRAEVNPDEMLFKKTLLQKLLKP
jgi:hypothetical protein